MKRKGYYVILLFLFSILYNSIIPTPLVNSSGSWVFLETDSITLQVSASADDGYILVSDTSFFDDYPLQIPIRVNYDDVITWLRFTGFNAIPWDNETHSFIRNAHFEFHHELDFYLDAPCTATMFYVNDYLGEDEAPPPTDYYDVVGYTESGFNSKTFNFQDMVTTYNNPVWYSTDDCGDLIFNSVEILNDTYGYQDEQIYLLESAHGAIYRYFESYDYNSNTAPKLVISYDTYIWSEYGEGYQETYRGFDIYLAETYEWERFSDLTLTDQYGTIDTFNNTHIETGIYDADWGIKFTKPVDEFVNEGYIALKWYMNVTYYWDAYALYQSPVNFLVFISKVDGYPWDADSDHNSIYLSWEGHSTNDWCRLRFIAQKGGGAYAVTVRDYFNPNSSPKGWWTKYYVNLETGAYLVRLYNDEDFTDLAYSVDGTIPSAYRISTSDMNYYKFFITLMHTNGYPYPDKMRNVFVTKDWIDGDTYYIQEDNETIAEGFDTIEEAKQWIDNYLDIRTDTLSWLGDFVIFGMGIVGLIMMMLSVVLFSTNVRNDFLNAVYLFMVLFFIGMAFVINWLWG